MLGVYPQSEDCSLADPMRSIDAILGRLEGLHLAAMVGSAPDPDIETRIGELEWVLEDDPETDDDD